MNNLLNGTGWGEHPEEEIKIAPWLTHEWKELDRKIKISSDVWESKGRARERRKNRKIQQHKENQWKGLFFFIGIYTFLAFAEFLCR